VHVSITAPHREMTPVSGLWWNLLATRAGAQHRGSLPITRVRAVVEPFGHPCRCSVPWLAPYRPCQGCCGTFWTPVQVLSAMARSLSPVSGLLWNLLDTRAGAQRCGSLAVAAAWGSLVSGFKVVPAALLKLHRTVNIRKIRAVVFTRFLQASIAHFTEAAFLQKFYRTWINGLQPAHPQRLFKR